MQGGRQMLPVFTALSPDSMMETATKLAKEGKYKEAELLFRELLLHWRQKLGGTHVETHRTMEWLATVLWYQGKRDEANTLRKHVEDDARRIRRSLAKWRAATLVIGRLAVLYRHTLEKLYAPGASGYHACRVDFEKLSGRRDL